MLNVAENIFIVSAVASRLGKTACTKTGEHLRRHLPAINFFFLPVFCPSRLLSAPYFTRSLQLPPFRNSNQPLGHIAGTSPLLLLLLSREEFSIFFLIDSRRIMHTRIHTLLGAIR